MNTYKRLDLTESEMKNLLSIIELYEEQGNTVSEELKKKILNPKEIEKSINKMISAESATKVRTKKAIKNIKLAIDYIERNNLKMTYSAIAKAGNISPITVKKYIGIKDGEASTNKAFYYANL